MRILDLVKDKKVKFEFYREGNFFYKCENGLIFPVPADDIGTATMLAEDKAIFFMRWIRKHLELLETMVDKGETQDEAFARRARNR